MTSPSKWAWTSGPGGLVRIAWDEDGTQRHAVFRTRKVKGGGLRVTELHLPEPTPLGLRDLRLGAVERLVNTPAIRDELLARMDEDAPNVFAAFPSGRVHEKTGTLAAGAHASGGVTLERPPGRRFDDRFYRQVLRAYDDAASRGEPILSTLMAASGAPRNTVARWLKEARRREKRLRAEDAS